VAKYRVFEVKRFERGSRFYAQIKRRWYSRWRDIGDDAWYGSLDRAMEICRAHRKFMQNGETVKHMINETS
jgi:hypothetical protein